MELQKTILPKGHPDLARTVLFLASDECPTATGADFIVDGGLTAGYIQPGIPGGD